jgi:hypothetical protein
VIYEYSCERCLHVFDVVKSVEHINRDEFCELCSLKATRKFVPSKVHFTKTKVTHAEYNPGLGKVVRNESERLDEAKRQGLIPVGNDWKSGESMQMEFDKSRAEKREKEWEAL